MSESEANPLIFDRALVKARRRRFGATAPKFLSEFAVQELGERLAAITRSFENVCALNAAPGLSAALRAAGVEGRLITLDSNPDLLDQADGMPAVADEEFLPLAPQSVSCIVSVLSLQLVNDLPGSLIQIRRALVQDGLFLGVLLGGTSLSELRQVFLEAEAELSSGVGLRVAPFVEVRDLGGLLQRAGFALPVADSDKITVRYDDFLSLLKDLRHLGWANPLVERPRAPLRRDVLLRAGELYHQRYSDPDGRIRASFELVWMTAWSPDESQPKPLRPGSAKTRLADALGTKEHSLSEDGE
ncbi:MAG: class I SAM-dependent methyltransferase [Pseudomonadota bacterium]